MPKINTRYYTQESKYSADITVQKYIAAGILTTGDLELIDEFIDYRKTAGHLGIKRAGEFKKVLCYMRKYIKTPYAQLTEKALLSAIGEFKTATNEKGRPFAQNTKYSYISMLKSFIYYLIKRKIIAVERDAIKDIETPAQNKKTTDADEIMTFDELKAMIRATDNPMYKAYLATAWETGARPKEVAFMVWSDLTADQYGFKAYVMDEKESAKKGYTVKRFARLTFAAPYLSAWKQSTKQANANDFIFINKWNKEIENHTMRAAMQYLGKKAGISKQIDLYSFRKGRINHMILEGMSETAIKEQIWKNQNSAMFEVYLNLNDANWDKIALKHQGLLKDETLTIVVEPKIRKCPKCGTINNSDAKFCAECGRALTDEAKAERDAVIEEQSSERAEMLAAFEEFYNARQKAKR